MYTMVQYENTKILRKDKHEKKIFTVDGKIVKFPKSGILYFPSDTVINVNKFLHFVKFQIDMTTNKSALHHNAIIEKYSLQCNAIDVSEEEKILASLELIEKL